MKLLELYQAWRQGGEKGALARELLAQTHWFTVHAEFDPKTGEALPQALSTFLAKLASNHSSASSKIHDRLYRIVEHVRPAIEHLLRALNQDPRREHAILPVRAARELDVSSLIKLSKRPGRTVREKLAGKPYLYAVRRFQSFDLPENRLLKACLCRLAELLELRNIYLGEQEDELLPKIRSWLLSDVATSIGRWENPPPNNTLLEHRDYRCVWNAWRRLQTLHEDIERDLSQLGCRRETMQRWTRYAQMYQEGIYRFADMPVLFDYDNFTVRTWTPEPLVQETPRRIVRGVGNPKTDRVVCIDLTEVHPQFADSTEGSKSLDDNYVWQQWKNETDTVDIVLFQSDALYLHSDAITIALPDLFFAGDLAPDLLDRAARAFVGRLREIFTNDRLIWLFPDSVNDFELEILRRNLNGRFPQAEPLPRSVAALFEKIKYSQVKNEGHSVVVVDTIGRVTCVTKFIAKFDSQLKKCLPETQGFYWERCPPVILSSQEITQAAEAQPPYDMFTVDRHGNWHSPTPPSQTEPINLSSLKSDARIGQFAFCIHVTGSPVVGGMRFQALQARAGDIPLWRDQIPELSIKVLKDGRYQSFYLVSRGTTVKPVRGLSVPIPVRERFTLPAGKPFYQFPLHQGAKTNEIRFSARLDSPAFPLKKSTECELHLTFRYGADDPYTLVFVPLDTSFPPVRATWQRTAEQTITNALAPAYPQPMSWKDLHSVPKPGTQETSDLLEWFLSATKQLDRDLVIRPGHRTVGEIIKEWRLDRNGTHYSFARDIKSGTQVFIHEKNFVHGVIFSQFRKGDQVSFEMIEGKDGRCWGSRIAGPDYTEETRLRHLDDDATRTVCDNIRKRLYFPVISIWKDARSVSDLQCPRSFAKHAKEAILSLSALLEYNGLPHPIRRELLFLLACMHKDTTEQCIQWITRQVEEADIRDARAIAFALGDLSEQWQQSIFRTLAARPDRMTVTVFAYAIWRSPIFVEYFTLGELEMILAALWDQLAQLKPYQRKDGKQCLTAQPLELLLGLLRTRSSNDPDVRMLLQPHQKITKQFAAQVDRIEEILAESRALLFSRVQIDIKKPEGIRTPDLLYALRLYLTGDDAANAIHIAGVVEDNALEE
ncbi:MAG: hypothetical protein KatS3mg110_0954 [Pirellulaceae bacterium]|nr:MAG: hypothetical protein KatS3mg110_0954 [Pirellulaceae bacterium]